MSDTTESGYAQTDVSEGEPSAAEVSIRRAPKISVFLVLGAVIGFMGTLILTALQPVDPAIGFTALFGYFLIYGIPVGVVLGAIVAVLFDRSSSRRAKIVPAERIVAKEPEASHPAELAN
jgi:H+/gluconate symporter-like permease